jgi:hypothetical protein
VSTNTHTAQNVQRGGMTFFGWLGLAFIILKLVGVSVVATWPWWLVLLPLWGGLALVLAVLLIGGLILGFVTLAMDKKARR